MNLNIDGVLKLAILTLAVIGILILLKVLPG
jgi:hypothetical protein